MTQRRRAAGRRRCGCVALGRRFAAGSLAQPRAASQPLWARQAARPPGPRAAGNPGLANGVGSARTAWTGCIPSVACVHLLACTASDSGADRSIAEGSPGERGAQATQATQAPRRAPIGRWPRDNGRRLAGRCVGRLSARQWARPAAGRVRSLSGRVRSLGGACLLVVGRTTLQKAAQSRAESRGCSVRPGKPATAGEDPRRAGRAPSAAR